MRPSQLLLTAACLMLFAGCPAPTPGAGGGAGGGDVSMSDDAGAPFATSAKANVRFKRNVRLTNDFAQALGLSTAELCTELGRYSCTDQVHPLALGGVDPYGIGLYEPLPFTGATSPLAVDRVALAACTTRVERDLSTPATAVLFKNITFGAGGALDVDQPAVRASLQALYERVLLRDISDTEVTHFSQLYRDIAAKAPSEPGKKWLALACFAALTSTESLFY